MKKTQCRLVHTGISCNNLLAEVYGILLHHIIVNIINYLLVKELAGSYVALNYSNTHIMTHTHTHTHTHLMCVTCSTVGISCSKSDRVTSIASFDVKDIETI